MNRSAGTKTLNLMRLLRKIPAPIICAVGMMISLFNHKPQLREFAYLLHRHEYSHELLVVTGTTWMYVGSGEGEHWQATVLGDINGEHVEVDAKALGYSQLYVIPGLECSLTHTPEAARKDLQKHFPVGNKIEVLRRTNWVFPVNGVNPYILRNSDYGGFGWLGFLKTFLIFNSVLILGVYCAISRAYWSGPYEV